MTITHPPGQRACVDFRRGVLLNGHETQQGLVTAGLPWTPCHHLDCPPWCPVPTGGAWGQSLWLYICLLSLSPWRLPGKVRTGSRHIGQKRTFLGSKFEDRGQNKSNGIVGWYGMPVDLVLTLELLVGRKVGDPGGNALREPARWEFSC